VLIFQAGCGFGRSIFQSCLRYSFEIYFEQTYSHDSHTCKHHITLPGITNKYHTGPQSHASGIAHNDAIHFDATAFGMPVTEASMLDPQQRQLLEMAAEVCICVCVCLCVLTFHSLLEYFDADVFYVHAVKQIILWNCHDCLVELALYIQFTAVIGSHHIHFNWC